MTEPIPFVEGQGCASDAVMRSAVEAWALARGWLIEGGAGMGAPWHITTRDGDVTIGNGVTFAAHRVSPHAAIVWALVLEARPLRDGSKCKRCRGRGTWDEWAMRFSASGPRWRSEHEEFASLMRGVLERDGFTVASHSFSSGKIIRLHAFRTIQCPDCAGTGLADLTDAFARHVLDAQPTHHGNPAVYTWTKPGAPASIQALHVLADQLQEWVCTACFRPTPPRAGGCIHCGKPSRPNPLQPLGLRIGMLLAGRLEGTADAVERLADGLPHPQKSADLR